MDHTERIQRIVAEEWEKHAASDPEIQKAIASRSKAALELILYGQSYRLADRFDAIPEQAP